MTTTLLAVQARTGSTRLPGKVLLEAAGAPLLQRQLERLRAVRETCVLALLTTTDPADDGLAALASALGVDCFRGHATDLLDRHYQAARAFGADVVVKVPSDCPLIDPGAVDAVLGAFRAARGAYDYCSNLHPGSWPDGNDVEVMSALALERAWREARAGFEREHTTPYLWERPETFRLGNVTWSTGWDLSRSHRLVLDYPEDYALIAAVYEELWRPGKVFGVHEVVALLARRPELFDLNRHLAGVNWYRHHLHELRTVGAADTRTPAARRT